MISIGNTARKKGRRFLCGCALFVLGVLSLLAPAAWAASTEAIAKTAYTDVPVRLRWGDANVLFMLDTGSQMTFTLDGVMPLSWRDQSGLAFGFLEGCTYGTGARPLWIRGAGLSSTGPKYSAPFQDEMKTYWNNTEVAGYRNKTVSSRFGRPRLEDQVLTNPLDYPEERLGVGNNFPDDPDCYYNPLDGTYSPYSPEETMIAPGFLTYQSTTKAAENWLVPNDSRMYVMKTILWNLTGKENATLLSRLNVGMATSYQEQFFLGAPAPQKEQFSNTLPADYYKLHYNGVLAPGFPCGRGPVWSVGNANYDVSNPSTLLTRNRDYDEWDVERRLELPYSNYNSYHSSQRAYVGVFRTLYDTSPSSDTWKRVGRALLKVPFGKVYAKDAKSGGEDKTSLLWRFRQYIDGIEEVSRPDEKLISPTDDTAWAWVNNTGDSLIPAGSPTIWTLTPVLAGRGENAYLLSDGSYVLRPPTGSAAYWADPQYRRYPTYLNPELFANGQTRLSTAFQLPGGAETAYAPYTKIYGFEGNYRAYKSAIELQALPKAEWQGGLGAGQAVGGIRDFFSPIDSLKISEATAGFFPVTHSCQSNWVVLFTAGENLSPRESGVLHQAVKSLYDGTKTMRGRSLNPKTGQWQERTFAMDQGVRTLVVGLMPSDVSLPSYARRKSDHDTMLKAAGLSIRKSLEDAAKAGDPLNSGDAKPIYVTYGSSKAGLAATVLEIVNRIAEDEKFEAASGSQILLPQDPAKPGVSRVAAFSYKRGALDQWRSWGKAFELKGQGADFQEVMKWEAGAKMSGVGEGRPLYLGRESGAVDKIKDVPSFANFGAYWGAFSKWMRAYRDVPTTPSPCGALGDVESEAYAFVPDSKEKTWEGTIYVQTNRGQLHALNSETGVERWGFIPPNILPRARTMKLSESGSWYDGDGTATLRSVPLDLLSGPLRVKTFTIDSKERTILLGTLGRGGNGLYAMDVSDPKASKPTFLWAVDNGTGKSSTPTGYGTLLNKAAGYANLGLTLAAAEMCNTSEGPLGIVPGGWGYGPISGDLQGKALYFFNPLSGDLKRTMNETTPFKNGGSLGMAVTPLSLIIDPATQKLLEFFTADSEGNVFRCDASSSVAAWQLERLFRLETVAEAETGVKAGEPLVTPFRLIAARGSGMRMIFGGTADVVLPSPLKERMEQAQNPQQFIFGARFPERGQSLAAVNVPGMADLETLKYFDSPADNVQLEPSLTTKGWRLRLKPAQVDADGRELSGAEYVTAAPVLAGGKLYCAAYIPQYVVDGKPVCGGERGITRLYVLNPLTGASAGVFRVPDGQGGYTLKEGVQALDLPGVKAVGLTVDVAGGQLLMGVERQGSTQSDNEAQNATAFGASVPGGLGPQLAFTIDLGSAAPTGEPYVPNLIYWRERVQ